MRRRCPFRVEVLALKKNNFIDVIPTFQTRIHQLAPDILHTAAREYGEQASKFFHFLSRTQEPPQTRSKGWRRGRKVDPNPPLCHFGEGFVFCDGAFQGAGHMRCYCEIRIARAHVLTWLTGVDRCSLCLVCRWTIAHWECGRVRRESVGTVLG